MNNRTGLLKTIVAMAEIYGRTMGIESAELYLEDLSIYDPHLVQEALKRCRKELPRFPTISDIIARIADGRPGPDEAWALIPKDESHSVCWTTEMADAYYLCSSLIGQDDYAARQAFKEKYQKLTTEARTKNLPCEWHLSLGTDKLHRESVALDAVTTRKISLQEIKSIVPEITNSQKFLSLENKNQEKLESHPEITKLLTEVIKPIK